MEGEESSPSAPGFRDASDSDVALVAAVAMGDRDALAALYDQHSQLILGLAKRMLDPAAAEDLLHDVFLEVWHHAADYSPERGSVRAWLMTRARSRALDRLGRQTLHARVVEEVTSAGAGPLASPDGGDLDARRVVHRAQQLSPELTAVLELAYFEGLSCSQIAAKLGVPVGTVKSRLARALVQLRQGLGFSQGGDGP